jgi:uncharacterized membrane protein YccF (DUF307 family)
MSRNAQPQGGRRHRQPSNAALLWYHAFGWRMMAIWVLASFVVGLTMVGIPLQIRMLEAVPRITRLMPRYRGRLGAL